MSTKHTPGLKLATPFLTRTRVPVLLDGQPVGMLHRIERTGWHAGPAHTYRFDAYQQGIQRGLRDVSGATTIKDALNAAIAKATGSDK